MRKIFCMVPAPLRFRCSRLIMVLSSAAISSFALALSHAALAGVSIDFVTSSRIHIEGKPDSSGRHTKTIRIDGPRFQLLSDIGRGTQRRIDETSLDDGATTFFPGERSVTQTPLIPDVASAGGLGGLFSPIKAWVEDDKMTISEPQPGPMLLGMPTQIYTVDHSYMTVGQIAFVYTRRFPTTARYVITTANLVTTDGLAISPAAVRVWLSRGSYRVLAHHPEAFSGFPLRIEAHLAQHSEAFQGAPLWVNGRLVNGEGATGGMMVDFRFEAVRIADWSWREKAVNK